MREAARRGQVVSEQVSLAGCQRLLDLDRDPDAAWVSVEAGMTLRHLHARLAAWGLALEHPVSSEPVTLAAALATGRHGSGSGPASLAAQVLEFDLVSAEGDVVRCSPAEEPDLFAAVPGSLGALGVVARVTLRAVPGFNVVSRETVHRVDGFDLGAEVAGSGYVSATWYPQARQVRLRRGQRTDAPSGGRGNLAAARLEAQTLIGPLLERLPPSALAWPRSRWSGTPVRRATSTYTTSYTDRGYRVLCPPAGLRYLESEWAIPRGALSSALQELQKLPSGAPRSWELTTSGAEDNWLSAGYGRPTAYLATTAGTEQHLTQWWPAVAGVMARFDGRPRLGGVVAWTAADLAPRFPRWAQWHALRRRVDPQGRLSSPESERLLGPVR